MRVRGKAMIGPRSWIAGFVVLVAAAVAPVGVGAQFQGSSDETDVTFARDIAPILQENCVTCHREGGVAPMPLVTYEQVRAFAPLMKYKTGLRDRAGAMPPFHLERDLGIQDYGPDILMLDDDEIAKIAMWADHGAPQGNPMDAPPPLAFDDDEGWAFEPDLVVRMASVTMGPNEPDKFICFPSPTPGLQPIGLEEDRYVAAVHVREFNDVPSDYAAQTSGARWIVHHMTYSTRVPDPDQEEGNGTGIVAWPVHELGRNADIFPQDEGRLLPAGSAISSCSFHLSSNGRETTAHLEIGYKFHPKGYQTPYESPIEVNRYGAGLAHDVQAGVAENLLTRSWVLEEHTKLIASEAHLHAAGWRMCLEAMWGNFEETLWCIGYDHNWVRNYWYGEDASPLLPKGTILRVTGELNNTAQNPNISDPRNWSGPGSITRSNMFHLFSVEVALSDEEFKREMAERVEKLDLGPNDWVIGCPLCKATIPPPSSKPADMLDAEGQIAAVSAAGNGGDR
jgi:mono/diheme cytochrome c family protein